MEKSNRKRPLRLIHLFAEQRRSSLFLAELIIGLGLFAAGGLMVLSPLFRDGQHLSPEHLWLSALGCAAIAVSVLILMTATLAQFAHELVELLPDEGNAARAIANVGKELDSSL